MQSDRLSPVPKHPTMRLLLAVLCPALVSALWPIPQHASSGTRALVLAPHFEIAVPAAYPADVRAAAARTAAFLRTDKLARLVPGRGASDAALLAKAGTLQALDVRLTPGAPKTAGIAAETLRPLGQAVEGYNLTVPASGRATLTAHSALGLARGLTTFGQMWWTLRDDVYMLTAPMEIEDAPAYVRTRV
jgi:hexosaminidase